MYISNIYIENFRLFGSETEGNHLDLTLSPNLNVLVGENDSGKSAVVDAVRYVLWTTSQEYHRVSEEDFHVSGRTRTTNLTIRMIFRGLDLRASARFLEWLSIEDEEPCLYITFNATRLEEQATTTRRGRNIYVTVRSGKKGEGRSIEGEIREFLRTTYLKPLRDAEAELSAGRGSRLSQILHAHPLYSEHRESDFDETNPETCRPRKLVGIMRQAEFLIGQNPIITDTKNNLNKHYLRDFSIGNDILISEIGVAKEADLRTILEKLELWLNPKKGINLRTQRGLGTNNVLFMATELLLLGGEEATLPLLLIEEPEAHLHPQIQLRLMEFLENRAINKGHHLQMIVTTHSPNLASKVNLENIIVMNEAKAYSLKSDYTNLNLSDYRFLRRFLDVTKANLFFAKGVVIVEGDAENILLPTLAKLIGRPFSDHGVSIVNVGSVGLFRYSRIFQRTDGSTMPVKVACIADRDIVPDAAEYCKRKKESKFSEDEIKVKVENKKRNDAPPVKTFVSPKWTMEHDLALEGLDNYVFIAVQLALKSKNKSDALSRETKATIIKKARDTLAAWRREALERKVIAAKIYKPILLKQASKSETAQFLSEILSKLNIPPERMRERLPQYLVDAIDYVTGHDEHMHNAS